MDSGRVTTIYNDLYTTTWFSFLTDMKDIYVGSTSVRNFLFLCTFYRNRDSHTLLISQNLNHCMHNLCVCVALSLQEGVAIGLEQEIPLIGKSESFFRKMQQEFYSKRDEMAEVLSAAGFKPIVPESGYFMVADTSPLRTYGTHCTTCTYVSRRLLCTARTKLFDKQWLLSHGA